MQTDLYGYADDQGYTKPQRDDLNEMADILLLRDHTKSNALNTLRSKVGKGQMPKYE